MLCLMRVTPPHQAPVVRPWGWDWSAAVSSCLLPRAPARSAGGYLVLAGALCLSLAGCGALSTPPKTPAELRLGPLHQELIARMKALQLTLHGATQLSPPERAQLQGELADLRAKRNAMVATLLREGEAVAQSAERGSLLRELQRYLIAEALAFDDPDLARRTGHRVQRQRATIAQARERLQHLAQGAGALPCVPAQAVARLGELVSLREALGAMMPITSLAVAIAQRCEREQASHHALQMYEFAQEIACAWDPMPSQAVARHAYVAASMEQPPPDAAPAALPALSAVEVTATEKPATSTAIAEPPEDDGAQLANSLRALREERGIFAALVALEVWNQQYPSRPALMALAAEWATSRDQVVQTLVERANRALAEENPDAARQLYQKVLMVDPAHPLARERMKRLDVLRQLRETASRDARGT